MDVLATRVAVGQIDTRPWSEDYIVGRAARLPVAPLSRFARKRRKVDRRTPFRRATSETGIPAATKSAAALIRTDDVRRGRPIGLPLFVPYTRARVIPAFVRSINRVRSCSATHPESATNRGLTGPFVSSHGSRTLITGTPIRSRSDTV